MIFWGTRGIFFVFSACPSINNNSAPVTIILAANSCTGKMTCGWCKPDEKSCDWHCIINQHFNLCLVFIILVNKVFIFSYFHCLYHTQLPPQLLLLPMKPLHTNKSTIATLLSFQPLDIATLYQSCNHCHDHVSTPSLWHHKCYYLHYEAHLILLSSQLLLCCYLVLVLFLLISPHFIFFSLLSLLGIYVKWLRDH